MAPYESHHDQARRRHIQQQGVGPEQDDGHLQEPHSPHANKQERRRFLTRELGETC